MLITLFSITLVPNENYGKKKSSAERRTEQYLADLTETTTKYTWKRTRRIVVYNDRGMPDSPSLWEVEGKPDINVYTSPSRFNDRSEAFNAASTDAMNELKILRRNAPISRQGDIITFEVHMGGVSATPRGRIIDPYQTLPRKETYWEYKYEVITISD